MRKGEDPRIFEHSVSFPPPLPVVFLSPSGSRSGDQSNGQAPQTSQLGSPEPSVLFEPVTPGSASPSSHAMSSIELFENVLFDISPEVWPFHQIPRSLS